MPINITIGGTAEEVRMLSALLRASGAPVGQADGDPGPAIETRVCPLCRGPYAATQGCAHKKIDGEICYLCYQAADVVEERFRVDVRRHYQDFLNGFAQMVRDRRAGAEEIPFYRGFE